MCLESNEGLSLVVVRVNTHSVEHQTGNQTRCSANLKITVYAGVG